MFGQLRLSWDMSINRRKFSDPNLFNKRAKNGALATVVNIGALFYIGKWDLNNESHWVGKMLIEYQMGVLKRSATPACGNWKVRNWRPYRRTLYRYIFKTYHKHLSTILKDRGVSISIQKLHISSITSYRQFMWKQSNMLKCNNVHL